MFSADGVVALLCAVALHPGFNLKMSHGVYRGVPVRE